MEPTSTRHDILTRLAPLVPTGVDPAGLLTPADHERLARGWAQLEARGFSIEVRTRCLRVRNGNGGFDAVIHLSGPEDLGELRRLFRQLRHRLGTWRDRWLPGLFRASPGVAVTYTALRDVIGPCQRLRERVRAAA